MRAQSLAACVYVWGSSFRARAWMNLRPEEAGGEVAAVRKGMAWESNT
jgi:hypothetical protein